MTTTFADQFGSGQPARPDLEFATSQRGEAIEGHREAARRRKPATELRNPELYLNRELSWLDLQAMVIDTVLGVHQADNRQARRLLADGTYERVVPAGGEASIDSQNGDDRGSRVLARRLGPVV